MWLELDIGQSRLVMAGDTVIQNGTRHACATKVTGEPWHCLFEMIAIVSMPMRIYCLEDQDRRAAKSGQWQYLLRLP
jgi:hypothetical protein